ncbi:small ribosomal subunit protein eS27-like isoform X1 [Oncorhynchus nerka]|uniref:small ribosomal subunit protein eS27-like isoform X1 n=1 Tax=Oncorhynchus nerka TaxID=8023 RepID=UPI0031B87209
MATKHFRPLLSSPVHLLTINFRLILLFGNGYKLANMPLAKDLLHPTSEEEKRSHKKKRLVQSPNSYFMDVKCPGCYKITTVFSHAQTVVLCVGCSTVLCQPTGGKARLTEGCSFRRKQH